jgi:hypothetical protein
MNDSSSNATRPPGSGDVPSVDTCIVCQSPIEHRKEAGACPDCRAPYHRECWKYNGGCGVYGCSKAANTEGLSALEIPAAHWGREDKDCPNCHCNILAAASRCKHCGATFDAATVQNSRDYQAQRVVQANLPVARKWAIGLLIGGLLPCTAPVAAVAGLIWMLTHKSTLRRLPPLIGAMAKIGCGLAWFQTVALILMVLLHKVLGG